MIVSDDEDIDALLTPYEMGKLTRRQLLPALAIMVAPVSAVAQQEQISGLVKPLTLDHVDVQVADLARAERFYRELLGVAALRPLPVGPGAPPAFGFGLPFGSFLSFQKNEKPWPTYIDHFCIAVEADPDLGKLAKELEPLGLVQGRGRAGILRDPDGLGVQVTTVQI